MHYISGTIDKTTESLAIYLANIYFICLKSFKKLYIYVFILDSLDDDMFPRDDVVVNF